MKREDLKKIEGLSDEAIDKIMALSGQDTEAHKKALSTLESERDQIKAQVEGLNTQLTEAGKTIDGFKAMDVDSIKKAADEYKAAAEKAKADAAAQLAALKFDHALEGALTGAKARNPKEVRVHLNMDGLKFNEADGTILGLDEQLKKVKESASHLFVEDAPVVPDPKIVDHAQPTTLSNPFLAGVFKGAGVEQK